MMHTITLISTIHEEMGKCNSTELCRILKKIKPEVFYLEALQETYTAYQKWNFDTYEVFHDKLEIEAIQKYSMEARFAFVPVLEEGLSELFNRKYDIVCQNYEHRIMLKKFNVLVSIKGFEFLNSNQSIELSDEMRDLEDVVLNDFDLNKANNDSIELYENTMLDKIYSHCKNNQFETAVFMCGVAHRKSIIKKITQYNSKEDIKLNWNYFPSK